MNHSVKGKRIGAAIIDLFITGVGISIITGILYLFLSAFINPYNRVDIDNNYNSRFYVNLLATLLFIIPTGIAPLIMFFLYHTIFPLLTKGATLGKLLVGIRVVNIEFKKATFKPLFLRNIYFFTTLAFNILPNLIVVLLGGNVSLSINLLFGFITFCVIMVIFIMILATDDECGFHDLIAKTYVVDKNFDFERLSQVNAMERKDMSWAIFEDTPTVEKPKNQKQDNIIEDDTIEILNRKD